METITFEGTQFEIDNLKTLMNWSSNSLPKERKDIVSTQVSTVEVNMGCYSVEMTNEQLKQAIMDANFLVDSVLVLINPEFCEKCWDINFNREATVQYLRDMFRERPNTNQKFIDDVFVNENVT